MPDKKMFPTKIAIEYLIYFLVVMVIAYHFSQLRFMLCEQYPRATLSSLVQGNAHTPFQYRILVPWIFKILTRFAIIQQSSMYAFFQNVEFVSVFFIIIFFAHLIYLSGLSYRTSMLISFLIILVLPFNYLLPRRHAFYYPSDLPAVLFFIVGLISLYRRRYILFYCVFILATFNRETTCFLTFIYFFSSWGNDKKRVILTHCVAQLIIWMGIEYLLFLLYGSNSNAGLVEGKINGSDTSHLLDNINFFRDFRNIIYVSSTAGFLWIPTLLLWRKISDTFFQRALLVVIPFFFGALYVGVIYELRTLGELIPIICISFINIIAIEVIKYKT